jgi:TolA-binding protein
MTSGKYLRKYWVNNLASGYDSSWAAETNKSPDEKNQILHSLQSKIEQQQQVIKALQGKIDVLQAASELKGEKNSLLEEEILELRRLISHNAQNSSRAFTASGLTTSL